MRNSCAGSCVQSLRLPNTGTWFGERARGALLQCVLRSRVWCQGYSRPRIVKSCSGNRSDTWIRLITIIGAIPGDADSDPDQMFSSVVPQLQHLILDALSVAIDSAGPA